MYPKRKRHNIYTRVGELPSTVNLSPFSQPSPLSREAIVLLIGLLNRSKATSRLLCFLHFEVSAYTTLSLSVSVPSFLRTAEGFSGFCSFLVGSQVDRLIIYLESFYLLAWRAASYTTRALNPQAAHTLTAGIYRPTSAAGGGQARSLQPWICTFPLVQRRLRWWPADWSDWRGSRLAPWRKVAVASKSLPR